MPFDLKSITTGGAPKPPRIVLYGPDKIGKTTFAVSAPAPIVIAAEDGLANFPDVPRFPTPETFADVLAALDTLGAERHDFGTLVIDTLDWLEPLIWAHTCARMNWPNIEKPGYGKGYQEADADWRRFFMLLNALRDVKGMAVICLAHFKLKPFNDPTAGSYDRYSIKLQERAAALVKEWADVIGFAHMEVNVVSTEGPFNRVTVRGTGAGVRRLGLEDRPSYQAGNRFGLAPVLPLSWDSFVAEYEAKARKSAAAAPAAPALTVVPGAIDSHEEPRYHTNGKDMPTPLNAAAEREMDEFLAERAGLLASDHVA